MRLHADLESIFDTNFQRSGFLGEQKYVHGIPVLSGGDPYPDWLWHYPAWIVNSGGKLRHAFTYTLLMHPLSSHQFKQTTTGWKYENKMANSYSWLSPLPLSNKPMPIFQFSGIDFTSTNWILENENFLGFNWTWQDLVGSNSSTIPTEYPKLHKSSQNATKLSRILSNIWPLRLFISGHSN